MTTKLDSPVSRAVETRDGREFTATMNTAGVTLRAKHAREESLITWDRLLALAPDVRPAAGQAPGTPTPVEGIDVDACGNKVYAADLERATRALIAGQCASEGHYPGQWSASASPGKIFRRCSVCGFVEWGRSAGTPARDLAAPARRPPAVESAPAKQIPTPMLLPGTVVTPKRPALKLGVKK